MAYISDSEKQTVDWFVALQAEAAGRATSRLNPLGSLVLALPAEPSEEQEAWLALVKAQAAGKGAAVNFDEHGVLVLVLLRYVGARQTTMELT